MPPPPHPDLLFGRDDAVARLATAIGRTATGAQVTVVVAGSAGIGKTSLVRAGVEAARAAQPDLEVAWGVAVEGGSAPGYWPWTQALGHLVRTLGVTVARDLAGDDGDRLASIVPALAGRGGTDAEAAGSTERSRLLLMDATARWLAGAAEARPVLLVLDDLQWADESSMALLEFLARGPEVSGLAIVAAHRPDELTPTGHQRLAALASTATHLTLEGLDPLACRALVERTIGRPVDDATADAIHHRTAGHPFFVRELALTSNARPPVADGGPLPAVVREMIERRLDRLSPDTVTVLRAAAVAGNALLPDVVAAAAGRTAGEVATAECEAADAGILRIGPTDGTTFAHDLFRETIVATIEPTDRARLHRAVGTALAVRGSRDGDVAPSEVARHFAAAVTVDGTARAVAWAMTAAATEQAALAFSEAAAQLRRVRRSAADAGAVIEPAELTEVLLAEAEANARAGNLLEARGLLRLALDVSEGSGDPTGTARVALATARLGAKFASRRDDVLAVLDRALVAVHGGDHVALEAQLTASLARELQHSVAEERPRSQALSEEALRLGRQAGDDPTLLGCLLARHDVLWTPGQGKARAEVAGEIVAVARRAGDLEREAEGLLLLANAQLEQGSGAFEVALQGCLAILDRLGQARHRYLAETRRACLALLYGRLDEAEERINAAADLGERIREPDAGNVRMSQRLELVRARGDREGLLAFADEAIEHWAGAPVHAHSVAAGFTARAGDLERARRHAGTVAELGGWRTDSSYLSAVFVRELGVAAVALQDRALIADLRDEVRSWAGSCGVNGAVVAFAGSHAHTAGLLAAALGDLAEAEALLSQACATYDDLGAAMAAEGRAALAALGGPQRSAGPSQDPSVPPTVGRMRRDGGLWHLSFDGAHAAVPASKGLADIARLVGQPGVEVHVLDLVGSGDRSGDGGPVVDRDALASYRRRLADIDHEVDEATRHHDLERELRLADERDEVLAELRRVLDGSGNARAFANSPAERARKAVTARVRDAIRRLDPVLPDLAAHLDRTIVTGFFCRYRAEGTGHWEVEP